MTNPNSIQKIASGNTNLADKIVSSIRTAKAQIKDKFSSPYANKQGVEMTYSQLNEAEKLWNNALQQTAENKGNVSSDNVVRNSITEIKGEKENYGEGVYLDTDLFNGTKPRDWGRILSKYVYDNLAGSELTVYDDNGNAEVISFAKKNERVQKDGANNSHRVIDKLARTKGNANSLGVVHIDELLKTATDYGSADANNHQWLDQNGWKYKKAYMQDIKGRIYETTLNIARTTDGRNILYALSNTKQIDEGVAPSTHDNERDSHTNRLPVDDIISNSEPIVKNSLKENIDNTAEHKAKQLEIIKEYNSADDDYHTWIRNDDDIKTFSETLLDTDYEEGEDFDPDYTWDMAQEAIKSGEMTVYSSYPIKQGVFVTPSRMEAKSYAGNGQIYEKKVKLSDVAWIDPTQGMYAEVEESKNTKFSAKENTNVQQTENDLSTDECQKRFAENVDKVFSGTMPSGKAIAIGDTPELLQKYGASNVPITINQTTMYKIAYPTGYFGAEEQGHNLGIPALKQLTKQIAEPIAILKSNSQDNSLVLLTEWEDTKGNPVIVPLHLNKNGAVGLTNEVVSAYGKSNINSLITDKNGNSTVLYTKNNESIQQLLSNRLQLPEAVTDDTLVSNSISQNEPNVKYSLKENSTAENMADELIKSNNSTLDKADISQQIDEISNILKNGDISDEATMNNAWEMAVVSAYKNKAVEQQMGTAQSHDPNVRNASADTASTDSISQEEKENNPKRQISEKQKEAFRKPARLGIFDDSCTDFACKLLRLAIAMGVYDVPKIKNL